MIIDQDVIWLDGYLKGLSAISKYSLFNALLIELPSSDAISSYMNYINDSSDEVLQDIDLPVLSLEESHNQLPWMKVVEANITKALSFIDKDLLQKSISQVLDILESNILENGLENVKLYKAKMGEYIGDYLFFKIKNNNYLVVSFLHDLVEIN